jgi:hypothetical protein
VSAAGGKGSYLPARLPRSRRWTESYGDVLVCNSQPVTITDVSVTTEVAPLSVNFYVHPIPTHRAEPGESLDLGSGRGRPVDGTWPDVAGRFLPVGTKGVPVDTTCDGKHGLVTIIVTMEVGPNGGMVTNPVITYRSRGEAFTVQATHTYAACGTALRHSPWCEGDPNL